MKPDDSIQEELRQIAPFLASLQKSHPFTVPKNYFDVLETTLISEIRMQPVSDEAALFGSKQQPFKVPDNYFREFPTNVLLKIKNEQGKINEIKPIIPFKKQLHNYKFWLAAASVALILVVSLSLFTRYRAGEKVSGENQNRLPGTAIENTQSDLLYAADIDESVVVDLYIQDQNRQQGQENSFSQQNMNNGNNYLRDAADIDPYLINEM
jgi:hypothetical protein